MDADDDVLNGFRVAVVYAAFTVPLQLILGLFLAVLLFQKLRFKSVFRVAFFLPYITPVVATSVVFGLLFAPDVNSPANQLLNSLGLGAANWLLEPDGVFQVAFGNSIPDALAGPALALLVIIVFGIWTFAGYSTVIFLA
ncbi:MAG: sugar ABC transporter permease, partial [Blastochloris sp.]|nr:sugar ABC transporter permease [Blastochloris sp.]